jgi:hypothetical protein
MTLRLATPADRPSTRLGRAQPQQQRPGEHHELVRLPPEGVAELERAAIRHGVPVSVALAALVEARLALQAVVEAGGRPSLIGRHNDREASLSRAAEDYLALLRQGPEDRPRPQRREAPALGLVPIPTRLLAFCDQAALLSALAGDLELALNWEAQAVRAGRTLTEWALRQALLSITGPLAN